MKHLGDESLKVSFHHWQTWNTYDDQFIDFIEHILVDWIKNPSQLEVYKEKNHVYM